MYIASRTLNYIHTHVFLTGYIKLVSVLTSVPEVLSFACDCDLRWPMYCNALSRTAAFVSCSVASGRT